MINAPKASEAARERVIDTLYQHGALRLESIAHFSELCHATVHRAVAQLEREGVIFRRNASLNGQFRIEFDVYRNVLPVGNIR